MFGNFKEVELNPDVKKISPEFYEIYSQAKKAKEKNLHLIIGTSYRKAIEFLIKDYLINYLSGDENKTKKKDLHKCIKDLDFEKDLEDLTYVLKEYGNEETHYASKTKKEREEDVEEMERIIKIILNNVEIKSTKNKSKNRKLLKPKSFIGRKRV